MQRRLFNILAPAFTASLLGIQHGTQRLRDRFLSSQNKPAIQSELPKISLPKVHAEPTEIYNAANFLFRKGVNVRSVAKDECSVRELKYYDHIVIYDLVRKVPYFVFEYLNPRKFDKECFDRRCMSQHKTEKTLLRHQISLPEDFELSPFDVGQMASSSHHEDDPWAFDHTYYMTNNAPQHRCLNDCIGGVWPALNKYVEELTRKHTETYVITGPIFKAPEENIGKIGFNKVSVPTHFFKMVIAEDERRENFIVYAFKVPNDIGVCLWNGKDLQEQLSGYQVEPWEIEQEICHTFFQDYTKVKLFKS